MEKYVDLSRYLCFILRHQPEAIGLTLDNRGYLDVDALIYGVSQAGRDISKEMLDEIIATDDKNRYEYDSYEKKIRCCQGHSIEVDVGLLEGVPQGNLYHGSATKYSKSIEEHGILKGDREYVHLSQNENTAVTVGSRHGQPVVYEVDCQKMMDDGYRFLVSKNNIWLTDDIPYKYLSVIS